MKNRILLSLIILFVALGQVWGAGSREPAATADDPITLRVWGGVPEENGPAELIANFEAANPDIRVEYTRFVNDDSGNLRLDTALIAGRQVDVYFYLQFTPDRASRTDGECARIERACSSRWF